MVSIDPTILIVMGEVMLGLLAAIVAIVVYLFKLKKRDKSAVAALQGRLVNNAGKREEWFNDMLSRGDISEEDQAANKAMASEWVNKENKFYSRLIDMYVQRNSSAMKSLDKMLHEYTSSYLDMVMVLRERVESDQAGLTEETKAQLDRMESEGKKLSSEVMKLKEENERLAKELEGAYAEIDQAMREYSLAFRPGGAVGSAPAPTQAASATATKQNDVQPPLMTESETELPVLEEEVPATVGVATEAVELEETADEEPEILLVDDSMFETEEIDIEPESIAAVEPEPEAEVESDLAEEIIEIEPEVVEAVEPEPELEAESDLVEEIIEIEPEVVDAVEPEPELETESELAEEIIEIEPEIVEAVEPEAEEAMSLEDVVLHAMAEENAALKARDEAAESKGGGRGPVIDLSTDDEIDLSELNNALADAMGDSSETEDAETSFAAEDLPNDNAIDEDALLAQLASIDDEEGNDALAGFGDFPLVDDDDDEEKKKEG